MSTIIHKGGLGHWVAVCCLISGLARGAVLYTPEQFTGDDGGWIDRDAGTDWDVAHNGGFGNPAGSLEGFFDTQIVPSPETDAWRANGAGNTGNFLGDYWTDVPGFTAWRFSFYAADILPSDLTIRFGDGVNTFTRLVGSEVTAVDQWFTIDVPLSFSGWFGGSASDFSNALSNVTFIDVQVTRNGSGSQYYYLDNFLLHDEVSAAVPEPATGLFWFGAVLLYGLRRHMNRDETEG